MIKFFRQIRKALLAENKFSKYLIYAIGEIILVVIGILIALQINNNNEIKKNRAKVDNLLEKIQLNIESDLDRINWLLTRQSLKDSLISLVLNDQVGRADYENPTNSGLRTIVITYDQINLKKHSFEALTQQQDIISREYDSIMETLSVLYSEDHDFVTVAEDQYKNEVLDFIQYDVKNHDWFSGRRPSYQNPEFIDYMMSSQYRSRVKSYSGRLRDYLNFIAQYRENAIKAYRMIDHKLEKYPKNDSFVNLTAKDSIIVGKYSTLTGQPGGEVYIDNGLLNLNLGFTAVVHPCDDNKFFIQGYGYLRYVKDENGLKFYNNHFASGKIPIAGKTN